MGRSVFYARYKETHETADANNDAHDDERYCVGVKHVEENAHRGRTEQRGDALKHEQNPKRVRELLEAEKIDQQHGRERHVATFASHLKRIYNTIYFKMMFQML